jgi:HK97 family phage prohead protease
MGKENREVSICDCPEIRMESISTTTDSGEEQVQKRMVGYAARFDTYSEDLGGFREIIRPGAFKSNLGANPVFALANHNRDLILGSTKNSTLKVSEDQYGLRVELTPLDTPTAREWMSHVENGVIDKMSFAFKVDGKEGERWLRSDQGESVRELHRVKLYDVSLVNQPAYQATSVGFRSHEDVFKYGEEIISADEQRARDHQVQVEHRKRQLYIEELENTL